MFNMFNNGILLNGVLIPKLLNNPLLLALS